MGIQNLNLNTIIVQKFDTGSIEHQAQLEIMRELEIAQKHLKVADELLSEYFL